MIKFLELQRHLARKISDNIFFSTGLVINPDWILCIPSALLIFLLVAKALRIDFG